MLIDGWCHAFVYFVLGMTCKKKSLTTQSLLRFKHDVVDEKKNNPMNSFFSVVILLRATVVSFKSIG